jgi:hypothetical protein
MKIKTNVRAGAGKQKSKNGGSDSPEYVDPAPVYVPPVSRCVGI